MKLRKFTIFMVLLILLVGYLFTRENKVTVYFGIANSELNELPLKLSINDNIIYNDTLINYHFKYEVITTRLRSGIHSVKIDNTNGSPLKTNVLILFNQHLVIEYYSPCGKKENCWEISNSLKKFRTE